jgi:uncharacterized membrane protein YqgA involved in biofilm formation
MKVEPPAEPSDSIAERPGVDRVTVPREWQFSLRSLLLVTTVVSICLAIGTYFAGVAFAAFVLVLLQVVLLFSVDWLIRPANRLMLAFVAAGSWLILGSGMLIISFTLAYGRISTGDRSVFWVVIMLITLAAPFCYWFAWRRWKRLTAQRRV